ncbi:MAG: D-sedoheptulose 7-phosphate isomerase [Candidatus Omnitrophota bacterium]
MMKQIIKQRFQESIQIKEETLKASADTIVKMAKEMIRALGRKKKIVLFGNGGSASDCQHMAAELIGRFEKERKPLAAIALTTDTSTLTALGNDYGFDTVFARQIAGLAAKGDMAFAISTSGHSKNVIEGVRQAKRMGLKTVALTGCDGGRLAKICDICLVVPSHKTARIQETHACVIHSLCELVENHFYKK